MATAMKQLKPFKNILKNSFSEIKNENAIFRLATTFTPIFLMVSSALLYSTELFGSPIKCMTSLPKNIINNFCWITSTFTIQDFAFREVGIQAAQPGVFTPYSLGMDDIEKKWVFHNYYQWVPIMLTLLAALAYAPKFIWKMRERGILRLLCSRLTCLTTDDAQKEKHKKIAIDYFMLHLNKNTAFAFYQWITELMALLIIIIEMAVMDKLIGGEFWTYGPKVFDMIGKDQVDRVDPMIYVFPRMTKCNFYKYGPSGTIEMHDNYCVLPQNIFNEKIFVFAWFWFMIIACLLTILLVYRLFLVLLPSIRPFVVHRHSRNVPIEVLKSILDKGDIGDFWTINLMSQHLDSVTFRDIVSSLAKKCNSVDHTRNGHNIYPIAAPSAPRNYECSSV